MIDETHQDQAALYVMRLLPPEEALQVARELESNAELRQHVAELEAAAATLAHAAPLRCPPPELKRRVLDSIKQESRIIPFPITRWIPWALAACAVGATCALWLENQNLRHKLALEASARQQRAELQTQMVNLRPRDPLAGARIATLAAKSSAYEGVNAVVVFDPKDQRGVLKAQSFPKPAAGKDHQLWVIEPGGTAPVSAGVVKIPTADGVQIVFRPERPITGVDAFAISVEDAGGSPTPRGEIVLLGK